MIAMLFVASIAFAIGGIASGQDATVSDYMQHGPLHLQDVPEQLQSEHATLLSAEEGMSVTPLVSLPLQMPGAASQPGHVKMAGHSSNAMSCSCRDGAPGYPGSPGVPGQNGHNGAAGLPGPPGSPGRPGSMGPQGQRGDRGPTTGGKADGLQSSNIPTPTRPGFGGFRLASLQPDAFRPRRYASAVQHIPQPRPTIHIPQPRPTIQGTVQSQQYGAWKQCSWNTGDDQDNGKIRDCVFNKTLVQSVLHVSFQGEARVQGADTCSRWYFTLNGMECKSPGNIDAVVQEPSGSTWKAEHLSFGGVCTDPISGIVRVGLWVGSCVKAGTYLHLVKQQKLIFGNLHLGDAYTGGLTTLRIIVEERAVPQL